MWPKYYFLDTHIYIYIYSLNFRFFAINVGIVYVYYNSFQKVDDEEYGGPSEILKEGLMTSFSTFLVSVERFF